MTTSLVMKPSLRILVIFVIVVHLMFFLLESLLWMTPAVYTILLRFLDNPVDTAYPLQAITLKNLFINQGFYNLFLVFAGVAGLLLLKKQQFSAGYVLILFLCFCGFGAGIVLACSTKAYILAVIQGLPAAIAFIKVYPVFQFQPPPSDR